MAAFVFVPGLLVFVPAPNDAATDSWNQSPAGAAYLSPRRSPGSAENSGIESRRDDTGSLSAQILLTVRPVIVRYVP